MTLLLDPNILLRILIVDKDKAGVNRLISTLSSLKIKYNYDLDNLAVFSIKKAYENLELYHPNVIFIDLLSMGLRDSITFVQHMRITHPKIVFVLYCDTDQLNKHNSEVYDGWGARLKHYFLLNKGISNEKFENEVLFNLIRVQFDLYAYGAQESLKQASVKTNESSLTDIQFSKLQSQYHQLVREMKSIQDNTIHRKSIENINQPLAFIIMAFNDELRDVYRIGLKEFLLNEFDLSTHRADEYYPKGLIINHIFEAIHKSSVVIAELTYPRPNCYYELGFADAIGKPIVRLAQEGTDLPFDNNQFPFIFYNDVTDLRPKLKQALIDLEVVK